MRARLHLTFKSNVIITMTSPINGKGKEKRGQSQEERRMITVLNYLRIIG